MHNKTAGGRDRYSEERQQQRELDIQSQTKSDVECYSFGRNRVIPRPAIKENDIFIQDASDEWIVRTTINAFSTPQMICPVFIKQFVTIVSSIICVIMSADTLFRDLQREIAESSYDQVCNLFFVCPFLYSILILFWWFFPLFIDYSYNRQV